METYTKKRIEIIVELPMLRRVLDAIDKAGASGYTVVPVLSGRGTSGEWRGDAMIGDTGHMAQVIVVTSEHRIESMLEGIYALVKRQVGIVTVSDVEVIRPEHFS
ncbi:DUF190 domain-containing protein [Ahrensia marina]|jgi:nitrogen regulatory protein PII|uniref:DUF190 domain-containing protein n=1 Tax=Ahrensia marina TaxID=1514904 RepID=UPI0035D02551